MKRSHFVVTCLLVASALSSGCALTTDRIQIQYQQQQGVRKVDGAGEVSVAVAVNDRRQDKSKVGSKKNGFGMEMAPILAAEEVAVTIQRAIAQEVQARGFKLGAETSMVQVSAEVTRFYNDHKMGFFAGDAVADLNLAVVVQARDGKILYSRQISVQGIEPNTQLATGENARLALNRSLENGMKVLFEDQAFLSALLAPKPRAGTNPA